MAINTQTLPPSQTRQSAPFLKTAPAPAPSRSTSKTPDGDTVTTDSSKDQSDSVIWHNNKELARMGRRQVIQNGQKVEASYYNKVDGSFSRSAEKSDQSSKEVTDTRLDNGDRAYRETVKGKDHQHETFELKRQDGSRYERNTSTDQTEGATVTRNKLTDTAKGLHKETTVSQQGGRKSTHETETTNTYNGGRSERRLEKLEDGAVASKEQTVERDKDGKVRKDTTVTVDGQGKVTRELKNTDNSSEDNTTTVKADGSESYHRVHTLKVEDRTMTTTTDGVKGGAESIHAETQSPDGNRVSDTRTWSDERGAHKSENEKFTLANGSSIQTDASNLTLADKSTQEAKTVIHRDKDGKETSREQENVLTQASGTQAYVLDQKSALSQKHEVGTRQALADGKILNAREYRHEDHAGVRQGHRSTVADKEGKTGVTVDSSELSAPDGGKYQDLTITHKGQDGLERTQFKRTGRDQDGWAVEQSAYSENGKSLQKDTVRRKQVETDADVPGLGWIGQENPQDLVEKLENSDNEHKIKTELVEATRERDGQSQTTYSKVMTSQDGKRSLTSTKTENGGTAWEYKQKLEDGREDSQVFFQGLRDSTIVTRNTHEGDWKVTTTEQRLKDFPAAKTSDIAETAKSVTRTRDNSSASDVKEQLNQGFLGSAVHDKRVSDFLKANPEGLQLSHQIQESRYHNGKYESNNTVEMVNPLGDRLTISRDPQTQQLTVDMGHVDKAEGQELTGKDLHEDSKTGSQARKLMHIGENAVTPIEAAVHARGHATNVWKGLESTLKHANPVGYGLNGATSALSGVLAVNDFAHGYTAGGIKHAGNATYDLAVSLRSAGVLQKGWSGVGGAGMGAKGLIGKAGLAGVGIQAGMAISNFAEGDAVGGTIGLGSAGFNGAALVAGGPVAWTGAAVFTLASAGWDYNKGNRVAVSEF